MKTFIKETVGNQLKNEITFLKSAVESNLNDLGDIVTKKQTKNRTSNIDHPSGVRVRGIPELKDTNARRRAEHKKAEIEKLLKFLNVDSNIEDCRRIGTYNESKERTIIVKLSNDWNRKLLLLSLGKLWNYDKKVYLSRELSKEEQLLENDLLNNRQENIEWGIPRNKVKVQNLKLLHYDYQSNTYDEAALDTGWWINTNENRTVQITLLTFNVHSILDQRRENDPEETSVVQELLEQVQRGRTPRLLRVPNQELQLLTPFPPALPATIVNFYLNFCCYTALSYRETKVNSKQALLHYNLS